MVDDTWFWFDGGTLRDFSSSLFPSVPARYLVGIFDQESWANATWMEETGGIEKRTIGRWMDNLTTAGGSGIGLGWAFDDGLGRGGGSSWRWWCLWLRELDIEYQHQAYFFRCRYVFTVDTCPNLLPCRALALGMLPFISPTVCCASK